MRLLRMAFMLRTSLGRAGKLACSPRVPLRLKITALLAALFILSPLNILGDIPFIGILDDVALGAMLVNWFVRSAGAHDATRDLGTAVATVTSR